MYTQMNQYIPPQQISLKRDGNYIGTLMLVLLAAMELTFSAVVIWLLATGVIDINALTDTYFGLDNTTYLLMYAAVYSFVFLVPTISVSACFKKHPFPLIPHKRLSAYDVFFAMLGAVGLCILTSVAVSILMAYLAEFGVPMPDMPSMLENTLTSYLLNLLVIAVLPALLEELLFRGCVLRVLRPYGDWFAITVSAILFGLMHGNIIQIPFALVVGFALGWLYVACENIWIPIAVHFANNALSVSMEYAMLQLNESQQNVFAVLIYGLVIAVGVGALIVMLVRKSDLFHRLQNPYGAPMGQKLKALLSAVPLLIAVIGFAIILFLGML